MKALKDILEGITIVNVNDYKNINIETIAIDSRKVTQNGLFIAQKGTQSDGHAFIDKAIENGATCIVHTEDVEEKENITYIKVKDAASATGLIACNFYNNPSKEMKLVGVTGTNGKTTIATLLYRLFRSLGYKTGLLSTVCNYIDTREVKATHTTPDAIAINALMSEMVEVGCDYCFMEISSHAIDQKRIEGLDFDGGIFTNITRDHLDYHKTFEAYRDVKKRFFDQLKPDSFALTNTDDKNGMFMLQNTAARQHTYSCRSMADYKVKVLDDNFEGMQLEFDGQDTFMQFVGQFNASNLDAVYATAMELGAEKEEVLIKMSTLTPVDGRFETIRGNDITAIVDYAHTDDALRNVLDTINDIRKGAGQLITVVGAGGNRDKGKRPMMAHEAAIASNQVILTSDNPRYEDPEDIIADMMAGIDASQKRKTLVITNRKEAIKTALTLAHSGDVVLIAGKGHETYQEVKGERTHFDDREIVREFFK